MGSAAPIGLRRMFLPRGLPVSAMGLKGPAEGREDAACFARGVPMGEKREASM